MTGVNSKAVVVGGKSYSLIEKQVYKDDFDEKLMVFPTKQVWQEPVVEVGQKVERKQLLAKRRHADLFSGECLDFRVFDFSFRHGVGHREGGGVQAHPGLFPGRSRGCRRHGGGSLEDWEDFFCPIIFGYLLKGTGLWTSCWMFMFVLSLVCLWWMHAVVVRMMTKKHPESVSLIEN